ncbi:glycoside hydrolase family 55 protein [Priestia megaterium]|uniref:glycoside hydrolase family 55 protein n=1 Tax=Priestia megaterium TaxID=1404 RepID=UPI001C44F924|nr:glycoside hydrolase family 55 protein [Priestia megaterium]MBV6736461.1 glycoside hydrolase family 55 protein [Priestia megaterium]MDR0127779.1 glycoside hydrolase family 55 protein [Priestia megaterium]
MDRRNFLVNACMWILAFIFGYKTKILEMEKINLPFNMKKNKENTQNKDIANRFISPLDFGAKGDNVSDDTRPFQLALDSLNEGDTFIIPSGTYLVKNLIIPDKNYITLLFYGTIKAIRGGDKDYLISTYKYVNNIPEAGQPLKIINPRVDGNNIVTNGLVIQTWDTTIDSPEIFNCVNGLKITAETKSGIEFPTSTLVNVTVNNPKIRNNSSKGIWIRDPKRNRVTDYYITNGFLYSNKEYGIFADSCAGALIQGVHTYSNNTGIGISIGSLAFRLHDCYIEDGNSVKFNDVSENVLVSIKGNIMKGDVNVYSSGKNCGIKGVGNTFLTKKGGYTQMWGGSIIYSTSDSFEVSNPYRVVGGSRMLNDSAPNKVYAQNCTSTVLEKGKIIQGVQQNNTLNAVSY